MAPLLGWQAGDMSHLLPKSEPPLRRHCLPFGVSLHRSQEKQVGAFGPGMPCFPEGLGTVGTFPVGQGAASVCGFRCPQSELAVGGLGGVAEDHSLPRASGPGLLPCFSRPDVFAPTCLELDATWSVFCGLPLRRGLLWSCQYLPL